MYKLKPYNKKITNQELIIDLKRVALHLGKDTVSYEEYKLFGICSSRIYERRFGSWNKALLAAGLIVTLRQDITTQELFDNLEYVWRTLGRQPKREELKKPISLFSKGTYERRFGGWRAALESFIEFVNSTEKEKTLVSVKEKFPTTPRFPDLRLRYKVLNRDSYKCQLCGRSPANEVGVKLHIDHIIPWSNGGLTLYENLRTLCNECNAGKGDIEE